MKISKGLTEYILNGLQEKGDTYKPTMFSKNRIKHLLDTSDYVAMAEYYIMPDENYGHMRGSKLFKEGERELTAEQVKKIIGTSVGNISKCLYEGKTYGNRFFVYESKDEEYEYTEFYIITRDLYLVDLALIFGKKL